MDPNQTLAILRHTIKQFQEKFDRISESDNWAVSHPFLANEALDDADTIVEAADALDQWMSKGGFKPTAWDEEHATPDYDPTCAPCQFGECTGH